MAHAVSTLCALVGLMVIEKKAIFYDKLEMTYFQFHQPPKHFFLCVKDKLIQHVWAKHKHYYSISIQNSEVNLPDLESSFSNPTFF